MITVQKNLPKIPLTLYSYQKKWIQDKSRLKIAGKSRRIGYSFAAGLAGILKTLEKGDDFIVLSTGERLSKLFIERSIAPHVKAMQVIATFLHSDVLKGSTVQKQEVVFPDCKGKIIALPANPETARSYEGNVLLDEFSHHADARKIYEAVEPSITRGFNLEVISTPNGQQGEFYNLAKAAGLVDGIRELGCEWSAHKTDIYEAIRQGCADRYGNPLDPERLKKGCLDDDMWAQEYCCSFLAIGSQWIPPDLFQKNVHELASADPPPQGMTGLYCGWDIGRSRDLSVLWFAEPEGDVSWTRGVIVWRNTPTPDQIGMARALMPMVQRMVIDKGLMGLTMFEILQREFPDKVEGVQFGVGNKEAMAVYVKRRMEEGKLRLPDDDLIRYSFNAIKRTVNAVGQSRFDSEHDEKYGHSDHWWACCLAEMAMQGAGGESDFLPEWVPPARARRDIWRRIGV